MTNDTITDKDIGQPCWIIYNGRPLKCWIRDLTLGGKAVLVCNYLGYKTEFGRNYARSELFWSYYLANKACGKPAKEE